MFCGLCDYKYLKNISTGSGYILYNRRWCHKFAVDNI